MTYGPPTPEPQPSPLDPHGDLPSYHEPSSAATLSPTAPPATAVQPPRSGHRSLVAVGVAIALAFSALTFVLGRNSVSEPSVAVPVVASTVTTEPAPPPAPVTAPTTTVPVEVPSAPAAVIPDTLEPVAAIAAQVGPAVVQLETDTGVGSGVIYDPSGLILTAAHVVEGATTVSVRLSDGSAVEGTIVGLHSPTDVAVVSIESTATLPVAELALGINPSIGSLAVALGSPFGLDQTVTAGVVSAIRTIGGVGMVQTDAAINPGNSGGPLVDRLGRVIGINDQIFTRSGANAGVGFAIGIDIASLVADQLVAGVEVQLARLGVSSTTSPDGTAGALVQEVVAGSAAAAAGVEVGDLIIGIDDRVIRDSGELRAEIISTVPGTAVDLMVVRDGEEIIIRAVLGSASF